MSSVSYPWNSTGWGASPYLQNGQRWLIPGELDARLCESVFRSALKPNVALDWWRDCRWQNAENFLGIRCSICVAIYLGPVTPCVVLPLCSTEGLLVVQQFFAQAILELVWCLESRVKNMHSNIMLGKPCEATRLCVMNSTGKYPVSGTLSSARVKLDKRYVVGYTIFENCAIC